MAIRTLAILHRWWGVAFCLLFSMWFVSGIVMHFVPFPARHEQVLASDLDMSHANIEQIDYDQWTVADDFDFDRPLKHIALNDAAGTELYISSTAGTVVLTTTRTERLLNYAGSIAHWLYPTELRHHKRAWTKLMWWLSLLATFGVALGAFLGIVRLCTRPTYRRLQRWHYLSGLVIAPVVLGWTLSGFMSMDDGWLGGNDNLFRSLHTFNFVPLASHPWLRTGTVLGVCLAGLAFSLTGIGLALRFLWDMARETQLPRETRESVL